MSIEKCEKDSEGMHCWESIGVIGTPGCDIFEVMKCTQCNESSLKKLNIIYGGV